MKKTAMTIISALTLVASGTHAFAVEHEFPNAAASCPAPDEKNVAEKGKEVSAEVIAFRLNVDRRYQRNGDGEAAQAAIDEYLLEQANLSGADRAGLLSYKGSLAIDFGDWAAAEVSLSQALAEPEVTRGMRSLIAAELKKVYGVTKQYEKLVALTERADLTSYDWNFLVDATAYYILSEYEKSWCALKQVPPTHRKIGWYSLLNANASALGRESTVADFLAVKLAKATPKTSEAAELAFWLQKLQETIRSDSVTSGTRSIGLNVPILLFGASPVRNPYREKQHAGRVCAIYGIGTDGVPTDVNVQGGIALYTKKYIIHDLTNQRYFALDRINQKLEPVSLKSCYFFTGGVSITSQGLNL